MCPLSDSPASGDSRTPDEREIKKCKRVFLIGDTFYCWETHGSVAISVGKHSYAGDLSSLGGSISS